MNQIELINNNKKNIDWSKYLGFNINPILI